MKIIAVGCNYIDHINELGFKRPDEPMIFMKPDSAILKKGEPFFYPEFSKDIHYETELIVKIDRLGRHIERRFAHRYYQQVSVGIDFTARDIQQRLRANGSPWEVSKGFDQSAAIGEWLSIDSLPTANGIMFSLDQNGQQVQCGNSLDMIFSIDSIIEYVSQFFTLKIGDIIFTGTPVGVGPIHIGDHLEGYVDSNKVLDVLIK